MENFIGTDNVRVLGSGGHGAAISS
jgi:hypothetical protein